MSCYNVSNLFLDSIREVLKLKQKNQKEVKTMVLIGIAIFVIFYMVRKGCNEGMLDPICYPFLWIIAIVGAIILLCYSFA